jgi:hypothetical protein
MKPWIKINDEWYEIDEIGIDHVTFWQGDKKQIVNKAFIDGYRLA